MPCGLFIWHHFFNVVGMTNKSSKSPTGEDREHNPHIRHQEVEKEDIRNNTEPAPSGDMAAVKQQPNMKNRGFQEDHPGNPVRTTGSTSEDQETLPTGEPDPGEI
jgi:hypothetical protein